MVEPAETAPAAAPPDAVLLARARGGEAAALEALLQRYQAPLFRFSLRMCRDPEEAREVLQDSLLAAARGIGKFRGDAAISTWLYAIARSFCGKRRRKARALADRTASAGPEALRLADPAQGADEVLADRELLQAIEGAVSELAPGYRDVLLLRDVEGLSAAEVASALAMSVPQVKSRLHRARVAVRNRLAPLLEPVTGAEAAGPISGCPEIALLFSRNREQEISAETCAEMQAHIDRCPRCQRTCDALNRTLALCRAVPEPTVPAEIQAAVRKEIARLYEGAQHKAPP